MSEQFSAEWAKGIIDGNMQKAQSFMDNPEQIEDLLGQLQEKLDSLPSAATNAFKNVPVMAQMVKSYATREYTAVSPKVVASLVAAFVYFVKKNDIIPDSVPLIGYADDLAVAAIAMVISEPELKAFADWQAQKAAGLSKEMPVEPVEAVEAEAADVQ